MLKTAIAVAALALVGTVSANAASTYNPIDYHSYTGTQGWHMNARMAFAQAPQVRVAAHTVATAEWNSFLRAEGRYYSSQPNY